MNLFLVIIGSISLALGVIGIFLPLLPTTPFLLLTAACYARGNQRFYKWLMKHPLFGEYIRHFRSEDGIPTAVKVRVIGILWLTIGCSAYLLRTNLMAVKILLVCATVITLFLLYIGRRKKNGNC